MDARSDRDEIQALIHDYAYAIDAGDIDGVVELFAHATIISSEGASFSGAETLRRLWADGLSLYDGKPGTHHLISNLDVWIESDGRTARARSYITVVQSVPGFPLQPIVAGTHKDRFEKVDDRWRFSERRDFRDLSGDLSRHFAVPGDD